jgi:hypothetical protein
MYMLLKYVGLTLDFLVCMYIQTGFNSDRVQLARHVTQLLQKHWAVPEPGHRAQRVHKYNVRPRHSSYRTTNMEMKTVDV